MAIAEQIERLMEGTLGAWLSEPPPPYVFEFSHAGLAWTARPVPSAEPTTGFQAWDDDVLSISPVKDNVLRPDALERAVAAAVVASGGPGTNKSTSKKLKPAAMILPDYSTRVAVLEFESFPSDSAEQLALVRFRMKKTVPFDLDDAAISYSARTVEAEGIRKHEVVVAAAPVEVVARYEAPLRAAGFAPGFVTTSMLAAMDLLDGLGLVMSAKLAGRVLTVTVSEGSRLKLLRCVEIDEVSLADVVGVLGPTVVFAEDELPSRPASLVVCGFGDLIGPLTEACRDELRLEVTQLASPWGPPDATNAGMRGYWMANGRV